MNAAKIKQKANELSELLLRDGEEFAEEYKTAYESGEYTEDEFEMIYKLCDVYTAVKQGYMSREDGAKKQKEILSGGKCD